MLVCNCGAPTTWPRFFNSTRFDIEAPRKNKRHGETNCDENNKHLLGPIRSMKNGQHGAHHLHSSSASHDVGSSNAIDAPGLQFLNEGLHAALPLVCYQMDDVYFRRFATW